VAKDIILLEVQLHVYNALLEVNVHLNQVPLLNAIPAIMLSLDQLHVLNVLQVISVHQKQFNL